MDLIDGVVRDYPWGTTDVIPDLLGRPATGRPWAEYWLGTHPTGSASVGATGVPLDELVAADPRGTLGDVLAERFGGLPFMMKLLSAAEPLSLQAHPSTDQAVAGFEHEELVGIPRTAPHRSFRDRRHKPELVCALTPFRALCGFREPVSTLDLLATLDTAALDPVRDRLAADPGPGGLRGVVAWLLGLDPASAERVVASAVAACRSAVGARFDEERALIPELAAHHPADAGVVIALLLNLVTLAPGDAVYLRAGILHAYLSGTVVEVMANSDNVLRGGLTGKHIDVMGLLDVLDTAPTVPAVQHRRPDAAVQVYEAPVDDFRLRRLHLGPDRTAVLGPGPAIALCTNGRVDVGPHTLESGDALWVPAADGAVDVVGEGVVFEASAGR